MNSKIRLDEKDRQIITLFQKILKYLRVKLLKLSASPSLQWG